MRLIFISLLAATLLASTAVPAAGQAPDQERSWSLSVFTEAGGILPIRSLGRNVGIFPFLDQQQVVSDLENATTLGGGLEVLLPAENIVIRAVYNVTTGGGVTGRLGFCGTRDDPLATGEICEPFNADARLHSFAADVGFLRRAPDAFLRPVIFLGLGLRKYQIGEVDCPPLDAVEIPGRTCLLLADIWQNEGAITPVLRFGVGLNVALGPVSLRANALDVVGRYPGGVNSADGHGQNDVMLSAGLAVKVF